MSQCSYLFLLLALITLCHGYIPEADRLLSSVSPNVRDTNLILVKIYCLLLVFFGTFAGGISPYFFRWNESFLVLGTQFAGGVFFGTALMHFLSDATETFHNRTDIKYPFVYMMATVGYLSTMLGDCIVQWIFAKEAAARHVDDEAKPSSKNHRDGLTLNCSVEDKSMCRDENLDAHSRQEDLSDLKEVKNIVKATLIHTTSFGDTILLILALCFHSFFEGIAIGVAETETDAWKTLWTVSLHKVFAAIAMGIALLRMLPNRTVLSCAAYAFSFAISSPIGISVGIVVDSTTQGPVVDWIFISSMGLACGVFVYVAINHLLAKGYVPQCQVAVDSPFYKFLAVLLGAVVIAVAMIWDT